MMEKADSPLGGQEPKRKRQEKPELEFSEPTYNWLVIYKLGTAGARACWPAK